MAITTHTITELYTNYKPAFNNLYKIEMTNIVEGENDELDKYVTLHAYNVQFGGESLQLTRNTVTKQFQLNDTDAYKRTDTLTIQWRENDDWEVKRYHENWIAMFYDKENDHYISYPYTKNNVTYNKEAIYRTFTITLPVNGTFGEDTSSGYRQIRFNGVLPQDAPGIALGWATQANIVTHSINYYVTSWEWLPMNISNASGGGTTSASMTATV